MHAKQRAFGLAAVAILGFAAEEASAYYAPEMGRYISRDPAGRNNLARIGAANSSVDQPTSGRLIDRNDANTDPMAPYHDGMNLYQYVEAAPLQRTDPHGLESYDPGPNYPHSPPPPPGECEEPCDIDELRDTRFWAGVHSGLGFNELPNGKFADGRKVNSFAHCLAACRVHRDMPECDSAWEQSEWGKNGKPRDKESDKDIRNNNAGRNIKGNCWNGCMEALDDGTLTCNSGGKLVPCNSIKEEPHPGNLPMGPKW